MARRFREGFCAERRRRLILAAAILASALGFIDGTIVSIAIPAMRETLGATLGQAQWISNAYMLPFSALILAGGAMGDRFGVARVFVIGIGVFILASVASALAPSPNTLIAARAFKGIGAALMVPGSLAIIYRAYPPDDRGRAIGIWAAASALTTALGPVIGGAALTVLGPETWRWLFGINLPLGALAVALLWRAVEEDHAQPEKGIDAIGAALTVFGLGLIAWALTNASGATAWTMSIAGIGLLCLFVLWEARTAHPMMPLAMFRSRVFSSANIATFTLYFALSAVMFFLPMTVIAGWGLTEAQASFAFIPVTVFIAGLSARFGKLADRVGPGILISAGSATVAVSYAALALVAPFQLFWAGVLPAMALMGFGLSMVVAPLSAAVMSAVTDDQAGAASGVNNAVSRVAGLVAVAAMGGIAAAAYASSGGTGSFGAPSEATDHAAASNAAFAVIAWSTAALAALSAVIAWVGIGGRETR